MTSVMIGWVTLIDLEVLDEFRIWLPMPQTPDVIRSPGFLGYLSINRVRLVPRSLKPS